LKKRPLYFSAIFLLTSLLNSSDSVLPNDNQYYKFNENNVEIIYPKEHLKLAEHTRSVQTQLHKDYEKFFNWKLDETLYVGLVSSKSQIANGFSTQFPNNRQINYIGGTELIDYFSVTSWLDTLLYHETSHNYQVNIKDNPVSKTLHYIFGNGNFIPIIPIWTLPNIFINSFMLEGNSVLNESWHGNGGRLYSGRFKVQTILQAASGNIVAESVYNQKISFPYGDIYYIQGGFYNYYLAEKYGLKKINSFFKYYSKHYLWPFFVNSPMTDAIGINFENSLDNFAKEYASKAKHLSLVDGKFIATSQFFNSLSSNKDEIFFLTNESGVRAPELIIINKEDKTVDKKRESYLSGKVIKVGDKYLSQASYQTSLTTIHQGLFDSDAIVKDKTKSKMVQGYLSSAKMVYFDVPSSFDQPQLYVGSEFYAQVNSSVIIDKKDNLYYFKQNGKTRTLYKNKTPLYSYKGFYGIVSDVDSNGSVYFIANSEYGSTLYRYKDEKVTRAHKSDNIIEVRLVSDNEVLVAAISEKNYYYVINDLTTIQKEPFETKLFFEDKEYYDNNKDINITKVDFTPLDLSNPYSPLKDLNYSGSNIFLDSSKTISFAMNFEDPLTQNKLQLNMVQDSDNTLLLGAGYTNSEELIQYSLYGYGVLNNGSVDKTRDTGVILNAYIPIYKKGRQNAYIFASYYQDYSIENRDPINLSFNFYKYASYGYSMYSNYLNLISFYGSYEKDNKVYGSKYSYKQDLPYEFYIGLDAKYSKSLSDTKGVKLARLAYEEDSDPTTIYMSTMDENYWYLNSAGYIEISLKKVINLSSYWFTFPISLQRESIYANFRRYKLEDKTGNNYTPSEATIGMEFRLIYFNKLPLSLFIEQTYSDAWFVKDKKRTRIYFNVSF